MESLNAAVAKWNHFEQPTKRKYLIMAASVCFFLFFVVLTVYSTGSVKTSTIRRMDVVVFMECNPEDLMALRYLFKRGDLRVVAIVLALNEWNQNLFTQYDVMLNFLSVLGTEGATRAPSVPVYYGSHVASRSATFDISLNFSNSAQTTSACTYLKVWPPNLQAAAETLYGMWFTLPLSASAAAAEAVDTNPVYYDAPLAALLSSSADSRVSALCLSTMTDFVQHWSSYPALRKKWAQVVISGGALGIKASGGDVQKVYPPNKGAEFNFFFDPRAANYALQSIAQTTGVILVAYDAAVDASCTSVQYGQLVVGPASAGSNTTRGFVSALLVAKRSLVSPGVQDLTAPQDLVAAAIFADRSLRVGSTTGSARLTVVKDAQLSLDGTVQSTTAASVPPVVFVAGLSGSALWAHMAAVESSRYPLS